MHAVFPKMWRKEMDVANLDVPRSLFWQQQRERKRVKTGSWTPQKQLLLNYTPKAEHPEVKGMEKTGPTF